VTLRHSPQPPLPITWLPAFTFVLIFMDSAPAADTTHEAVAGFHIRLDGDLLHEFLLADAAAQGTAVAGLHMGLDGDPLHGRFS
jgi:hypothetical protein